MQGRGDNSGNMVLLSPCVPFRWQGNWIRRGAKRPENPVTRFPAGRRGPRSGEGVYEGKKRKDTLRLSRPPNGGQAGSGVSLRRLTSYTLCHYVAFPSRGNKGLRRESYCVICFLYHSRGTPFGCWRHHLSSAKEALIKSLSDFILEFLSNARNKSTRIASYLRRLMTQHWIKIHMKFDSAN